MRLKSIKFINLLSKNEETELRNFNEEHFEKTQLEQFLKADSDSSQGVYFLLSTALLITSVVSIVIADDIAIWHWMLNLAYTAFYAITNTNFRRIFVKLKYNKSLPLVDNETLKTCYSNTQRLRSNAAIMDFSDNPGSEIVYYIREEGVCIARIVEENEKQVPKVHILPINKVKYDDSITEIIYDVSDLSLTFYSEMDPVPRSFWYVDEADAEQQENKEK